MRHPTRIRQLHGFFEGELDMSGPGFDHFKKGEGLIAPGAAPVPGVNTPLPLHRN